MRIDQINQIILEVIRDHKEIEGELITLAEIEKRLWKKIENMDFQIGEIRLGDRITDLYLNDLIINKDSLGYNLTKKGRDELASIAA